MRDAGATRPAAISEAVLSVPPHRPRVPGSTRPDEPDGFDPFQGEDFEDSWEPPQPALAGPWQLLAALLAAIVAGLALLGAAATVSWLFR